MHLECESAPVLLRGKIINSSFMKQLLEFVQYRPSYLVTLLENYSIYIQWERYNWLWCPFNSQLPFESCPSVNISIVFCCFRSQILTISWLCCSGLLWFRNDILQFSTPTNQCCCPSPVVHLRGELEAQKAEKNVLRQIYWKQQWEN